MNINWKVRFRNPVWWAHVAVAIITPVLAYLGLTGADLTTWGKVWDTLAVAATNPYVLSLVVVSVWNTVNDPTTAGLSDSSRALTYTTPYPKNEELPVDLEEV